MATVQSIISAAFRKIGVTPTSTQIANALISLNNMISLWGADFMVPTETVESATLSTAVATLTVGPSKTLDTSRPSRLVGCYLRDADGYDHPVEILSREDYNRVFDKDSVGRPTGVFFDPTETYVTLYFNKLPDYAYTAYFTFWKNFTEYATETATYTQPNEYKKAMVYNLAIELDESHDRPVPKSVYVIAKQSYDTIERLNASNRPPPKARFDFGGSRYNINTDEVT